MLEPNHAQDRIDEASRFFANLDCPENNKTSDPP